MLPLSELDWDQMRVPAIAPGDPATTDAVSEPGAVPAGTTVSGALASSGTGPGRPHSPFSQLA